MELNTKLTVLERMIEIYDRFVGDFPLACEKYCAHCCTANVTMTTLEGYRILEHLEKQNLTSWMETIAAKAHPGRFIPAVTINRMADICARDGDPPEEELDPAAGPCPGIGRRRLSTIRGAPLRLPVHGFRPKLR